MATLRQEIKKIARDWGLRPQILWPPVQASVYDALDLYPVPDLCG